MNGDIIKIELNKSRVRELLQSPEIMSELKSQARSLGEVDTSYVGFDRAHVRIKKGAVQSVD